MNYVIGTMRDLPTSWVSELALYRHRVFVERLGWQLPCQPGVELDEFDRDETLYVISHGAHERVTGCARLLPTVRPYLLSSVFPELMGNREAPCSPQVWELSRFAAMDLDDASCGQFGRHATSAATELLQVCLRCASEHGVTEVITISPLGIERLLRKSGFRAMRMASPKKMGNDSLFACRIVVAPPRSTAPG